MSVAFDLIYAAYARGTHRKLALDALRLSPGLEPWQAVFLKHHFFYLSGAKAPDDKFHDYQNHVLHVAEGWWGGACRAAHAWFAHTVSALADGRWEEAAYAAGVLSHYVSDPFMPLHTGQSEAEGPVHRPAEWSIAKSYHDLRRLLVDELDGYPNVEVPSRDDWLEELLRRGAAEAHRGYDLLIDHYDVARAAADPPAALDDAARRLVARLLGLATATFAQVLERAVDQSRASPPALHLAPEGILAALMLPLGAVLARVDDLRQRARVRAICAEYQELGKVVANLPADERALRRLHADEVLRKPLTELDRETPRRCGQHYGESAPGELSAARPAPPRDSPAAHPPRTSPTVERSAQVPAVPQPAPAPPPGVASRSPRPLDDDVEVRAEPRAERSGQVRFRLAQRCGIEDAPAIGPKAARRLQAVGIKTVGDLLATSAEVAAKKLGSPDRVEQIRQWQAQAMLACRMPEVHGHDVQLLVGSGIHRPEQLVRLSAEEVLERVRPFAESEVGQRVLRSGPLPDLDEVRNWIAWARQARPLSDAA